MPVPVCFRLLDTRVTCSSAFSGHPSSSFCIQLNHDHWKDRSGCKQKCQHLSKHVDPKEECIFFPSLTVHVGSATGWWYGSWRRLRHWIVPSSEQDTVQSTHHLWHSGLLVFCVMMSRLLGRSGAHFSPRWTLIDYSLQVAIGRFKFFEVSNLQYLWLTISSKDDLEMVYLILPCNLISSDALTAENFSSFQNSLSVLIELHGLNQLRLSSRGKL